MASKQVIYEDEDVLRKRAKEVDPAWLGTDEAQKLIDDMVETMYVENGVGLAAPQIGESIRVIIVDPGHGQAEIVANPVLEFLTSKTDVGEEGCLSVPGRFGRVKRVKKVKVTGLDRHGNALEFALKGFHARVYQHELDHLDRVLIVDKFEND